MPRVKTIAAILLRHAARVLVERNSTYGSISLHFPKAARLWSVILDCRVEAWQVALCLDALKTTRILANPGHLDSWIDKCGYSAIGAEVAPIAHGDVNCILKPEPPIASEDDPCSH
jgi:hypothetical protein